MNDLARVFLAGTLALPICAWAAPFGYSVNSDQPNGDALHRIDLATGEATRIGLVQSIQGTKLDVEGLAFDPNGTLWGMDDQELRLFPITTANGLVTTGERSLRGIGQVGTNDFGMAFTCDGELFATSIADPEPTLYRVALDGQATPVGPLGARISALAAWGNPARFYGLGNGLLQDGQQVDSRMLYEIDPASGAASPIGSLGPQAGDYFQAGLSFDETGQLWAITDRRGPGLEAGSEVLLLDLSTGSASLQGTTTQVGFESLAVAAPGGCEEEQEPPPQPPPPPPPQPPAQPRDGDGEVENIPVLGQPGRIIFLLLLLATGLLATQRRP